MFAFTNDPMVFLTTLFCAGLGLGLVGVANAVGIHWSLRNRMIGTLGISASVAACAELLVPRSGLPTTTFLFSGWMILRVLDSAVYRKTISLVSATVRSPRFPGVVLASMGFGIGFGAIGYHEWNESREMERDNAYLVGLCFKPPVELETDYLGTTDLGTPLRLNRATVLRPTSETTRWENEFLVQGNWDAHVIRRVPAEDTCNCHGWVFSGGRYWMGSDDVARILKENGYQVTTDPKPGDLAIYYSSSGNEEIAHTAVVKGALVDDVLVEGKWGALGVYLHPARESTYGDHVTFFRSDRKGHRIVGLDRPIPSTSDTQIQLSNDE